MKKLIYYLLIAAACYLLGYYFFGSYFSGWLTCIIYFAATRIYDYVTEIREKTRKEAIDDVTISITFSGSSTYPHQQGDVGGLVTDTTFTNQ